MSFMDRVKREVPVPRWLLVCHALNLVVYMMFLLEMSLLLIPSYAVILYYTAKALNEKPIKVPKPRTRIISLFHKDDGTMN